MEIWIFLKVYEIFNYQIREKTDRLQYVAEKLLRANKPNKNFFLMYICKWDFLSFSS